MASDDKKISVYETIMEALETHGMEGMKEVMRVMLNEAMIAERTGALGAEPYERSEDRRGYANGFKPKTIITRLGAIKVEIPQVRNLQFYPQTIEKGSRSEKAFKLALAQAYIEGVSTRRVTEITEELCGVEVSATQVSRIAKTLDEELEKFRTRDLGEFPYVILDARYEKVRYDKQVIDCAVLIAIGVNPKGKREVLGVSVKLSEAGIHWKDFLQCLVSRGLAGVKLVISDDHAGLKKARQQIFPQAKWQRCQFHFAQDAQHYAPKKTMKEEIAQAIRDIFACSSVDDARNKVKQVSKKYTLSAPDFSRWLEDNVEDCFTVYSFPRSHWIKIRTSNAMENLNRQIKRRTTIASIFPSIDSCLRLVSALLAEIHDDWIADNNLYLDMKNFKHSLDADLQIYRKKVA